MEITGGWIEHLLRFETVAELRASAFWKEHGRAIDAFLATPQVLPGPVAGPRLADFVRVAQWNIEKGKRREAILATLREDPALRWADIVLLNEADRGMYRSGNRHVAAELGRDLGMHVAWSPAHLELTLGTDDDLLDPGENGEGLQGNAVLSRHPVIAVRTVPLPVCFEPFEFHEKRYGRRNCVWAKLRIGERHVWAGCTHLEVRNTPGCRAIQMRYILENLPGGPDEPYLLGGDLNSNGFARGTALRTILSACRLAATPTARMIRRLASPDRGPEPLFEIARRAGFEWEGLNSGEDTASAPIGALEDAALLPAFLNRLMRRRLAPYGGFLHLRLDWILGRGVRPLSSGELRDGPTGTAACNPGRVLLARSGAERPSDHSPIFADGRLP
jgi:endonuclease/exonuclease/phosphatase family metal-dependent hydrolase